MVGLFLCGCDIEDNKCIFDCEMMRCQSGQFFILNQVRINFSIRAMDLHDSPATINSSKEVDLITPESNNHPKRHFQDHQDTQKYETKRKMVHLNNQNENINTITPTRKKIQPSPAQQTNHKQDQPGQQEKDQKRDPILSTPLRQKFAHLIPDYQSAEYSHEQRMLLRIQSKLDEHLLYLKVYRGRKRGEFFKRCHIIVDLVHFKQILFIDNDLYSCSRQKDQEHNYDILIDLPNNSDIHTRKLQFKQKLYTYLQSHGAFRDNQINRVSVPLYKFPFEEQIEHSNMLIKRRQQETQEREQVVAREDTKLTLQNMFSKDFKFKETLYQKIMAKENKIKQQSKAMADAKKYGKEELLSVLDEVHLTYSAKKMSNMFRATVIESVSRRLNLQEHIVNEILDVICQKGNGYMKKLPHSKGLIFQIDKKIYSQTRKIFIDITV